MNAPLNAIDLVLERLRTEEGFRSHAYRDTSGKLTIGYGCNIDAGWSPGLADCVLRYQLNDVWRQIQVHSWWAELDAVRASVLLDIAFNEGMERLLLFKKMLAAVDARNWRLAHDELLDSEAARELPDRYNALAKILLSDA